MNIATRTTQFARWPGDPRVEQAGPGSQGAADRLARAIGWFSIGLGLFELAAPGRLTRLLGMEGREGLVRVMGARELGSGMMSLSVDHAAGLWARVAGDAFDLVTLASAWRDDNPQKRNVGIALAAVAGITALDLLCAQGLTARHGRGKAEPRDYSQRSGFPRPPEAMRGAARRPAEQPEVAPAIAVEPRPPAEERPALH